MMTEATGVAERPKQRMRIELKENLTLNMLAQGEWLEMETELRVHIIKK